MDEPVLRLTGIGKRFGPLVANDDISLTLMRGEVLALLGENGAGKSTLMSILFGHYVADAGTVEVFGRRLPPGDPRAALAAGVGMVHQHFTLADNLTVLDNTMLGTEPLWRPFSRRAAARARLLDAARRFGLEVDPDARVGDLSVGERQRVEILKTLVRGARILILDEPTAVLTPQESESLFATLRGLVADGLSIVFISHKLDEVLRASQRIAVLRAGRLVATLDRADADRAKLAELMVGRTVIAPSRRAGAVGSAAADLPAAGPTTAPAVIELRDATVEADGRRLLDRVSLTLAAGEIVAVAGVAGNGQQALAEVLFGLRSLKAGIVCMGDRALTPGARRWVRAGVARIPEDRQAVGVIGDAPLWENAISERYAERRFSRMGVIDRRAARRHAQSIVKDFDVRGTEAGGVDTVSRALSGGNIQKLILGRALQRLDGAVPPALVVADQPTWGLDIGAVAYVHQRLLDAAAAGAALLLISEDLDEIFALADRIAVMHAGRLGPARPVNEWTLARIGLAMTGGDAAGEDGGSPADDRGGNAAGGEGSGGAGQGGSDAARAS